MKKIICILVIGFFFLTGCSTKKNTFVNRSYHNITTKYNVLYNGNLALEQGITSLHNQYKDDFWKVLPIEPLKIDEETYILPGKSKENSGNSSFDIAEQKAVKAIQKHSMNVSGSEHNKQIDDAYLLLGKARYYSQRFVPALEAFDYVIKHYPDGDLNRELRIWKAKSQIRLQNEEQAIVALKRLLQSKKIEKEIKEEAHTALAMAYLSLDSISQATTQLQKAVNTHENKEQYTRNLFILGQLFRLENKSDSSKLAFQQIIDFKKSPRKYKIHSFIEQAKSVTDTTNSAPIKKQFDKLLKNTLNSSYFDEIYYQLAQLHFKDHKDSLAIENLRKSIQSPKAKKFQKVLAYENLGNYYFDKADFIRAGAYYDSVIPNVTNPNTKRIRRLNRKRKSLEEVIAYETSIQQNDSIFSLVAMSDAERKAYFTDYVNKLKKADELAAILKENAERTGNSGTSSLGGKQSTKAGKWYFYNTQTVGFGQTEFQKIWGNRSLQDNWRWSQKVNTKIENSKNIDTDEITEQPQNLDDSKKYDVSYYIAQIPTDSLVLQKMHNTTNNALYQLGLIYKEKFVEYPLAIKRLERFLLEKPKEKMILPAKYHLYKMYEKTQHPKLEILKQEIIAEYPDSRYAKLIQHPNERAYDTSETPEAHYENVYCDYEYEKYNQVINACEKAIIQYENEPIQAKFELLKAYALLKTNDKSSFIKGLEFVVTNYPKTEESTHAQEVLNLINGVKKETVATEKQVNKKEIEENKKQESKEEKNKIKPLSDEEKRKKVLELMKKKGPPRLRKDEENKNN